MSKATGVAGKTPQQLSRHQRALERQAARNNRTVDEQLLLLDTRPGNSSKERAGLIYQLFVEASKNE